jgi:hypothetical protein
MSPAGDSAPMSEEDVLTIFAAPRSFDGIFERIQMNTLRSWAALRPRPEILVFGKETGTAEACERLGLRWMPEVAVTGQGLPVLSDLFLRADRAAAGTLLAYVNIDILLMQDALDAVARARAHFTRCVLVGAPWNVEVPYDLDTEEGDWETRVRLAARRTGKPPPTRGADVFVYPRGYFSDIPPLAVGRFFFDTWLMAKARFASDPVVDITEAALLVHQDHSGSSHAPARVIAPAWLDVDALANRSNTRWWTRHVFRRDIPLVLTPEGALRRRPLTGRLALAVRIACRQAIVWLLDRTHALRHALGIYRWWRRPKSPDTHPEEMQR